VAWQSERYAASDALIGCSIAGLATRASTVWLKACVAKHVIAEARELKALRPEATGTTPLAPISQSSMDSLQQVRAAPARVLLSE
jgi:hypothetical protein